MGDAARDLRGYRADDDPDDPTFYPIDDHMGEDAIQRFIAELLRPLLARFLAERCVQAFVGADQFIYWSRGNPRACVSPDIYVMPGVSPKTRPRCWKVWQTGVVPSFALEVMAKSDEGKDIVESPRRYQELGTPEVIVFDPYVDEGSGRARFRVHRRNAEGKLVLVLSTSEDRVHSEILECWIRAVGKDGDFRLRIGTGPEGETLYPTEAEAERVKAESANVRAREAEEELARLRAEMARLRAGER